MKDEFANIPNRFGLTADDFSLDMESYAAALGFLGDVSSGSTEDRALTANGGSQAKRRAWEGSQRFRMALARARQEGAQEAAYERARAEAQRTYDPFAVIPERSDPDPGESGWLRRWTRRGLDVLEGKRDSQASNFIALEDMSDAQVRDVWAQHSPAKPAQATSPFRREPTKAERERMIADGSYAPTDVERGFDGFPR